VVRRVEAAEGPGVDTLVPLFECATRLRVDTQRPLSAGRLRLSLIIESPSRGDYEW